MNGIIAEFSRLSGEILPGLTRFTSSVSEAFTSAQNTARGFGEQIRPQLESAFDRGIDSANEFISTLRRVSTESVSLEGLITTDFAGITVPSVSIGDIEFNARVFGARIRMAINEISATDFAVVGTIFWESINLAFDAALIIGAIRQFGSNVAAAFGTALRGVTLVALAERFGDDVSNVLNNLNLREQAETFGRNIVSQFGGPEANSGITALGLSLARAFLDTVRGGVVGVFTAGDTFGESLQNVFTAALSAGAIAAFASQGVRSAIGRAGLFLATGGPSADLLPGRDTATGLRNRINLDAAGGERQLATRRAVQGAAGLIGALVASEFVAELGGSDFAVVGAAIAGQVATSFITGTALASNLAGSIGAALGRINLANFGVNVAGAISNGLLGLLTALRVPPAAAGAIATSLFVACLLYTSPSPRD